MKKNLGRIFTVIGLLLLAAALVLAIYNIYTEKDAGRKSAEVVKKLEAVIEESEEPLTEDSSTDDSGTELKNKRDSSKKEASRIVPDYVLDPNMEMPAVNIDGIDYIGTIEIPVLELKLPVISSWDYPSLRTAPCRYEGSVYLDNLIIAGHNYWTHFGGLRNLSYGDEVTFTDSNKNIFKYRVAEIEILDDSAVEEMTSGDWDLTLFTCTPSTIDRVTVRCERISE